MKNMSSSTTGNLMEFMKKNEDEIKSGLKVAGKAIETAHKVHQQVQKDEQKASNEVSRNESQAERDTAEAAKLEKQEEDDIAKAEASLQSGLNSLGELVKMVKEEESGLDADISELTDMAERLRNNPSSLGRSDVKSLVEVAGEAYNLVEDEINAEDKLSQYFVYYATDLDKVVGVEEAAQKDLKTLEEETEFEAQRSGHKNRMKKLMQYESKEEDEFKQEVQELKQEFSEEESELQMLQKEIIHTKEELDKLIQTYEVIESQLQDLGYESMAQKIDQFRQSAQQDYDKLEHAEEELQEAESRLDKGEKEIGN